MKEEPNRKTHVCFGLRAENLDPTRISDTLGLQPTHAFAKGDIHIISPARQALRPWGVWQLRTDSNGSDKIDVHLVEMLKLLEPRNDIIAELRNQMGLQALLKIFWRETSVLVGLTISAELLRRALAFVDLVDLTIWPVED
jgi:hypothetical protein